MNNILIAEDDKEIVEILALHLEDDSKRIFKAYNGQQALDVFDSENIDIMLVDVMMPEIDGLHLIKKIREKSNIPIIVISAKTMDEDKILGLNLGADDYIEKPFKVLEVAARVNAQLRRFNKLGASTGQSESSVILAGDLKLDTQEIKLYKNDVEIDITTAEFKIMKLFMQNPNRVFTKVQIYNKIFGEYYESDENTIMVHISNLRAKIEKDSKNPKYIKTIRGLGYKFEA